MTTSTSPLYTASTLPSALQALQLHYPDPNAISYKQLKESFVSGHTGVDGFTELSLLLLSVGLWMGIWRIASNIIRHVSASSSSSPSALPFPLPTATSTAVKWKQPFSSLLPSFLIEFSCIMIPIIWSMTLGANWVTTIFLSQIGTIGGLILVHRYLCGYSCLRWPNFSSAKSMDATDLLTLQRMNQAPKQFITNYRTSLMIGTSIAILAVDFVFFPRRYCKTENFGLGMMDGGVGSFIISHALTSIHARGGGAATTSNRPNGGGIIRELLHILRSIFPLVALGIARLFTIKAVDYQEHVSEYGVHWNFFFTLAAVAILSGVLSRAIHPRTTFFFGFIILIIYQLGLSLTSLTDYILTAPRTNLFSANKEGLWSSVGYFSLYLISVRGGYEVLSKEDRISKWWSKIGKLIAVDILLWCATLLSSDYIQPPSRRMVNLSYALWMISLNLLLLIEFMLLDLLIIDNKPINASNKRNDDTTTTPPLESTSMIVEAINKNSLPFFLLCNLCTGAINLSMQTIFASDLSAMSVVSQRSEHISSFVFWFIMVWVKTLIIHRQFVAVRSLLCFVLFQVSFYAVVTCLVIVYVDYRGWIIKL